MFASISVTKAILLLLVVVAGVLFIRHGQPRG
jgi:hypothetical protein